MDLKKLFPDKNTECKIDSPWFIEEIMNGLKARSIKMSGNKILKDSKGELIKNKNIAVHYFEYDRILGRNAFAEAGVLKVLEMFNELKDVTPMTVGYIFRENSYLNFKRGILKRNNRTGKERFFSEETLRNESLDNYLQLSCSTDPLDEKKDTDREEVHSHSNELQTIED